MQWDEPISFFFLSYITMWVSKAANMSKYTWIISHIFFPFILCWILTTCPQHLTDLPHMYLLITSVVKYIECLLIFWKIPKNKIIFYGILSYYVGLNINGKPTQSNISTGLHMTTYIVSEFRKWLHGTQY